MSTLVPEEFSPSQVDAMTTWLELGTTSLTNPVLRFALNTFLTPLGVACDWLEYDVIFSTGPNQTPRLHNPAFRPSNATRELAADFHRAFGPLAEHPTRYAATLGIFANLQISPHPPGRKPDEVDRQLAHAAETAPGMVREAFTMAHRYLQTVGEVLISDDAGAEPVRQKLIDKDYAGFAEGALAFSAQ